MTNAQDVKLIYVGDPMCSWCYGFAPELSAVINEYKGDMKVELVMGGLRPYFDQKMTEMKDFLTHHWEDVHKASGQPFTYDILNRSDLAYDTEPPARAVVVVRSMDPQMEYPFFVEVQRAFYFENMDMNLTTSYHEILNGLGLSTEVFDNKFESEEFKSAIKNDFARASELGASSFPTLFIQSGTETPQLIAKGYVKHSVLSERVSKFLN